MIKWKPNVLPLPLLFVALIVLSCADQSPTAEQPINSTDMRIKMIDCTDSIPSKLFTDHASIKEVKTIGDSLKLIVTYGGGCETHEFALYCCTLFMKSDPPQTEMYLSHNAHGDQCKKLITDTLIFNLEPLKEAGTRQFQNLHTIIMQIHEPGEVQPFSPLPRYEF